MKRLHGWLMTAIAGGVLATGCDDTSTITSQNTMATMRVHFDHEVVTTQRAPLDFDDLVYTNDAGNTYSIKVLQYIVSNITLHTADWSIVYDVAHYRDAREEDTRTVSLADVPVATYDAITFTFGLDGEKNFDPTQGGDLPQTPDWEAMRWPTAWGGGYHYMKLEGDVDDEGTITSYRTHTGKRQSDGTDPNFPTPDPEPLHHNFTVTMNTDDIVAEGGDVWEATIYMNVDAWYRTNDLGTYDLTNYLGGMMTNTAAQNLLAENGPSVFSLGEVTRTETAGEQQ